MAEEKRLIFDTNIYGELILDPDILKIKELILEKKFIIYGNSLIRKELRNAPQGLKIKNRSLRIELLNLYDFIVGRHVLELNDAIFSLSKKYYEAYRQLG